MVWWADEMQCMSLFLTILCASSCDLDGSMRHRRPSSNRWNPNGNGSHEDSSGSRPSRQFRLRLFQHGATRDRHPAHRVQAHRRQIVFYCPGDQLAHARSARPGHAEPLPLGQSALPVSHHRRQPPTSQMPRHQRRRPRPGRIDGSCPASRFPKTNAKNQNKTNPTAKLVDQTRK